MEGGDYDTLLGAIDDLRAADPDARRHAARGAVGERWSFPGEDVALRQDGQDKVAHLSTNSAHAIAERSGHFIQIEAPDLVVTSVRQVVEAARTRGRVDAKALEPFLKEGVPEGTWRLTTRPHAIASA